MYIYIYTITYDIHNPWSFSQKKILKTAAPLGSSEYSCPAPHCAHLEASPLPWLCILIELAYPWAIGFWTHLYHGLHCYISVHAPKVSTSNTSKWPPVNSGYGNHWLSQWFPLGNDLLSWRMFLTPSIMAALLSGLRALGAFCPKTSQAIPRNLGLEGSCLFWTEFHETTGELSTEPQIS